MLKAQGARQEIYNTICMDAWMDGRDFLIKNPLAIAVATYVPGSVINPRRACAARVTVVVLCVCPSVCLSATILGLQATRRLMSDTNSFSATRA